MKNRTTPNHIKTLKSNEIFVFGSNSLGNHAGGAAKLAKDKFKAEEGIAKGATGQCYAIDTMSGIDIIKEQVQPFFDHVIVYPQNIYLVTEIGCGIAGYSPEQIAPLFKNAPENIFLPESFWMILNTVKGYKIFDSNMKCRDFQYEIGKEYHFDGPFKICNSGFHFCIDPIHCFSYYEFDPKNIVCEVESQGDVQTHSEDSKVATNHLKITRKLSWDEVLKISNKGENNLGYGNAGNYNAGEPQRRVLQRRGV